MINDPDDLDFAVGTISSITDELVSVSGDVYNIFNTGGAFLSSSHQANIKIAEQTIYSMTESVAGLSKNLHDTSQTVHNLIDFANDNISNYTVTEINDINLIVSDIGIAANSLVNDIQNSAITNIDVRVNALVSSLSKLVRSVNSVSSPGVLAIANKLGDGTASPALNDAKQYASTGNMSNTPAGNSFVNAIDGIMVEYNTNIAPILSNISLSTVLIDSLVNDLSNRV